MRWRAMCGSAVQRAWIRWSRCASRQELAWCGRRMSSSRALTGRCSAMETVIFACVHNAGRSQMAAALFSVLADPRRARAISAGTRPGERVHPIVVEVMKDLGIDLSSNRPQKLTDGLARGASLLITMGCGDECPFVPGLARDDWPLTDPKDRPIDEVRAIRDDIQERVRALVDAHLWNRTSAVE